MMPPLMTVGSSPPASSSAATIEVVVVLPCVPPMAIADFEPHQLGQHLGAPDDRQAARPRLDQLGIVALDRRRDDDDRRIVEVLRIVADRDLDPAVAQALHVVAVGDVGAVHAIVLVGENLGDAAHADAADPDEVDRPDVARQFHRQDLPGASLGQFSTGHGLKRTPIGCNALHQVGKPLGRVDPALRAGRTCGKCELAGILRADGPADAQARSASAQPPGRATRPRPRREHAAFSAWS